MLKRHVVYSSTPQQEAYHTPQINAIHAAISAFQCGQADMTIRTRTNNSPTPTTHSPSLMEVCFF
jgi:hypothetical protein